MQLDTDDSRDVSPVPSLHNANMTCCACSTVLSRSDQQEIKVSFAFDGPLGFSRRLDPRFVSDEGYHEARCAVLRNVPYNVCHLDITTTCNNLY